MKEIEGIQYSKENTEQLENLTMKLKEYVLEKEDGEIFFLKNNGLSLILRLLEITSAMILL
jgi:hypothetical protein